MTRGRWEINKEAPGPRETRQSRFRHLEFPTKWRPAERSADGANERPQVIGSDGRARGIYLLTVNRDVYAADYNRRNILMEY